MNILLAYTSFFLCLFFAYKCRTNYPFASGKFLWASAACGIYATIELFQLLGMFWRRRPPRVLGAATATCEEASCPCKRYATQIDIESRVRRHCSFLGTGRANLFCPP